MELSEYLKLQRKIMGFKEDEKFQTVVISAEVLAAAALSMQQRDAARSKRKGIVLYSKPPQAS